MNSNDANDTVTINAEGVKSEVTFKAYRPAPVDISKIILQEHEKLLHFVRHAQGHHNVAGETHEDGYLLEENEDSALTDLGIDQCRQLYLNIRENNATDNATLLVVSPMRRTLQTAAYSFPHHIHSMRWVALETLREQSGLHPCDRRRPTAEIKSYNPHVDFSEISDESDPLFFRYPNIREPRAVVMNRARDFMAWIAERPEKEIIVVTHSAYLRHLFAEIVLVEGEHDHSFKNCEMRSIVVSIK